MGGLRAPACRSPSRPCSSARSPSRACRRSSGFWSKDEIIWGAFAGPQPHPVLGVIGYVAAGLTAFYMGRLLFLTFFGACAGRSSHAGAPARVAGGDDGAADRARGAGRRGRLHPDPAHRRAGDRRGARRARAARRRSRWPSRSRSAGSGSPGSSTSRGPICPGSVAERARAASIAWCATSTASTSCTTASSTGRSWPWPTPRRWVIDGGRDRRHRQRRRHVRGVSPAAPGGALQTGNVQHYALSFLVGRAGACQPTTSSDDAHRRRRPRRPLAGRDARHPVGADRVSSS